MVSVSLHHPGLFFSFLKHANRYKNSQKSSLPPHIYMIADMTHQAMVHNKNPQVRKYMQEMRRKTWLFEGFELWQTVKRLPFWSIGWRKSERLRVSQTSSLGDWLCLSLSFNFICNLSSCVCPSSHLHVNYWG